MSFRSLSIAEQPAKLWYVSERTGLDAHASRAVAYALATLLGKTLTGRRRATHLLLQLFGSLGGVDGPGVNGSWPDGPSVLRWLGMSSADLDDEWGRVEASSRLLPDPVLAAFFPPRLWMELHATIENGPLEAHGRLCELLRAWAAGRELTGDPRRQRGTRRATHEDGSLSAATINLMISAFFGFMGSLDELRILEHDGRLDLPDNRMFFQRWNRNDFPARPTTSQLNALPANTNRDAMSLRLVRLALLLLCEQIDTRKLTLSGRRMLFKPLRDRALIATLAVTGLRLGAFARLTVADLEPSFLFPDNERGAALVPRPGKSLARGLKRPKGIPTLLFEWTKEYLEYAGSWGEAGAPLWLPQDSKRLIRREALSEEGIREIVRTRFSPALCRRSPLPEFRPLRVAFLEECDGRVYSPHQLRHLAEQVGFMVGLDWLEENRERLLEQGSGLPANPQVFPDALLDHSMRSMGDRYKDVASERGRLKWARKCALGNFEYIVGSKGARVGPDLSLIREQEAKLKIDEARQRHVDGQLGALETRIIASGESLDVKEIVLANVQMGRMARQLADAAAVVERARSALADARTVRVPIPDQLTAAAFDAPV